MHQSTKTHMLTHMIKISGKVDKSNAYNGFRGNISVVVLKGQKWITKRDVRFTAVYIYGNTESNGYLLFTRLTSLLYWVSHYF